MDKPPDIHASTTTSIYRKYTNLSMQKYIVISRADNNTFDNVSPFLIKKTIDFTCGGEVESCKKTRAGTLLIKTKNTLQATKLLKLKQMANMEVTADEHKTLNSSKGVIYSNELRNIEETEILNELKLQNVTEVRKILKKQDHNLAETGLIIITFGTHILPESLKIGYENTRVRPYIALPLRCKKCLRFGHPTPTCKSPDETCKNCSATAHTAENEQCNNEKNCLNCKYNPDVDSKHSPMDRKCPAFIKQQELVAIKTTEKVDHKTALAIYFTRHKQHLSNSFATTVAKPTPTPNINTSATNTSASTSTSQRSETLSTTAATKTSSHAHQPTATLTPQQHHHTQDMDMDIDTLANTRNLAAEKTKDLKLRIYPKEKNNSLSTTLKPPKLNLEKSKTTKNNKHKHNSDNDSI